MDPKPVLDRFRSHQIQQLGRFLSAMVMPNIGAFIAWGLLSALFIPSGWFPNPSLAKLTHPMIMYLLPLLIGFTGGKAVYGHRGGVVGAVATMGVVVGAAIPMFLGAMVVGPLAGWLIKKIDTAAKKHTPAGFEMLVNNFSSGILAGLLAVSGFLAIGPVVEFLSTKLGWLVARVIYAGALPVTSVLIEPAKVLFLNNAMNHGVLGPLGVEQAAETGKSIFFLLETNPGPGLGILLVYLVFGKGISKHSAPGAILIHFLGGIHEIYFPYILMQPRLLLAVIAGGATGVFCFAAMGAGLVAVPSPGSIVAMAAMTPKGDLLPVLAGIALSTAATFLTGAFLFDRKTCESSDELHQAQERMVELKGKSVAIGHDTVPVTLKDLSAIHCIAVACDGGMGSSAMGASKLRSTFAKAGVTVKVISSSIDELDYHADLVITHEKLTARAAAKLPAAFHISITDFINSPVYAELTSRLSAAPKRTDSAREETAATSAQILKNKNIKIGLPSASKEEAIREAGRLLCQEGYVDEDYIAAMLEREKKVSTYIGNGVAIPHGSSEAKRRVKHTGICVLQFPEGVDFDGNVTYLVVGIAAKQDEHLQILARLAKSIENEAKINQLLTTTDASEIHQKLTGSDHNQSSS